jgi:ABC-type nickel/cobalt efflux system permease component RcnA
MAVTQFPRHNEIMRIAILSVTAIALLAACASAHPVPKDNHDRTIVVRLQKGQKPNEVKVHVEYRLEVDETTVYLSDMKDFRDQVNPLDFRGRPLAYYAEFAKIYEEIYADRLVVRVNKKEIGEFRCISHKERLNDEDGKSLGHLRCDFVFETTFFLEPNADTRFRLREQNYLFDAGQVTLSVVNETGEKIISLKAPDDALRKQAMERPGSVDETRLREIEIVFKPMETARTEAPKPVESPKAEPPVESSPVALKSVEPHNDWFSLEQLILPAEYGVFLTLVLAFLFGAAHALTPGHGKTLVAAYLVGERGTVWHAVYLGLVTTLTHTGVVIAIALILIVLPTEMQHRFKTWIQNGLGLIMGLIVACMGFALLLQRLAGKSDHIHIGAGHHHHHDAPSAPADARGLNWWGLTVLGITGGMIPCWDAVAVLFVSVGRSEFWFVLPVVLIFSAGLALVLVAIGILVVQAPRYVESRFGSGRLLKVLPIVSAVLVTAMGIWLCYEGVHGK